MTKIRVLVASPYQLVRSALRQLLNTSSSAHVVGETETSSKKLIQNIRATSPDILLVVTNDDEPAETRTVALAVKSAPQVPVLVLTANENASYVRATLSTGARGYILKTASPLQLEAAIRQVHHGRRFIDPQLVDSVTELLLDAGGRTSRPPLPRRLSAQEARILRYIARGFTTRETAEELDLSPKTVETYRSRLYEKLRLRRRADLVHYAIAHGFLRLVGRSAAE